MGQTLHYTSVMAEVNYYPLAGEWPVLKKAERVSKEIMNKIRNEGTGISLTNNIEYFSLGYFFIDTVLLGQHPTQRSLDYNHVATLEKEFERVGCNCAEHPGVVIGLGEGWYDMKKTDPKPIRIATSSPHLGRLRTSEDGVIGQIIRGGHRTAAIKLYTNRRNLSHKCCWYYQVLIPCTGCLFFSLECIILIPVLLL